MLIRDGQVRNRPVYAAIGVDLDGHKDVLGMWAGDGDGESAKFWLAVLTELRNRGVKDVFFVVCDGLKGLPDSVSTAFPQAIVQTCIIHLIRNTFRYASRKFWDKISFDLKPIYTAATAAEARVRYDEFAEKWGRAYPAIKRLWDNAWEEFIPFLDYDVEIRKVLCSTDEIVKPVCVPELASWVASGRRRPDRTARPVRRSPSLRCAFACCCRRRQGSRGCPAGTAHRPPVRACGVCG